MYNRNEKTDYETDEYGRPDDKDYTYRIPLDDDVAFHLASLHIKGRTDRFVSRLRDHDGNGLRYMVIKTQDNKGHLDGLESYSYSEKWRRPFKHSRADWEVRPANGGGSKIRGTFTAFDSAGHEIPVGFDGTVSQTVGTIESIASSEADEEVVQEFQREVEHLKDEGIEEHQEWVRQQQEDCDHDHFVNAEEDRYTYFDSPDAVGYCEDCGAELDDEGHIVGGRTM